MSWNPEKPSPAQREPRGCPELLASFSILSLGRVCWKIVLFEVSSNFFFPKKTVPAERTLSQVASAQRSW